MSKVMEEFDLLEKELTSDGFVLVLHNDDHNTFDWVIETLMDLAEYSMDSAQRAAFIVHHTGKHPVTMGSYQRIVDLHQAFGDRGLSTTVEVV